MILGELMKTRIRGLFVILSSFIYSNGVSASHRPEWMFLFVGDLWDTK